MRGGQHWEGGAGVSRSNAALKLLKQTWRACTFLFCRFGDVLDFLRSTSGWGFPTSRLRFQVWGPTGPRQEISFWTSGFSFQSAVFWAGTQVRIRDGCLLTVLQLLTSSWRVLSFGALGVLSVHKLLLISQLQRSSSISGLEVSEMSINEGKQPDKPRPLETFPNPIGAPGAIYELNHFPTFTTSFKPTSKKTNQVG